MGLNCRTKSKVVLSNWSKILKVGVLCYKNNFCILTFSGISMITVTVTESLLSLSARISASACMLAACITSLVNEMFTHFSVQIAASPCHRSWLPIAIIALEAVSIFILAVRLHLVTVLQHTYY